MQYKQVINQSILFFSLNLLLVILTFFNSFSRMAGGSPLSYWILIHAFCLSIWTIILFIQPLLIFVNNKKWHKRIGFFSILIVILVVITTCFSALEAFGRLPDSFRVEKKYSILITQFYGMMLFTILYTLSLLNRKDLRKHVQYIMTSLIVILGPVICRTIQKFHLNLFHSVELTCNVVTFGILDGLLIAGIWSQLRKGEKFGPFLFTLLALLPVEISQTWFAIF